MQPYIRLGESDQWYVNFGRIGTIGGLVVAMGTALIASTYDNLMNYVQALFSIFNAPLFATFIIGMFWRRMTPWAGFWGLVAGTIAAAVTWIGYKVGWFGFDPSLSRSCRGSSTAWRTWTSTPRGECTSGGSRPACSGRSRSAAPPS